MNYTNRYNLPTYLADWIKTDKYDYNYEPNTISATTLLKPVRAHIISGRHAGELQIDVSELIASKYGNAIHDSVERIDTPGVQKEQRTTRKIDIDGAEYTVTGKYDILVEENGVHTLRDMKSTSVWSFIYGGKDDDYRHQLSIYRWLLSQDKNVNPVAYIDFFFTDWQSVKARTEQGYPGQRIQAGYKIDLLSLEDTEALIRAKLTVLQNFRDTPDDQLPLCSKEELWAEEDTFAVYKIGNKRATKVFDNKIEAVAFKDSKKLGFVQDRPGKVKRCGYCSARPWCNQFEQLKKEGLIAE